MTDSEVLTMEVVGEFLSLDTDRHIWQYFRQHRQPWFPLLGSRTTFAQQAANLWVIKQQLHRQLVIEWGTATDPIHFIDGCPLPLCVLTRASRCRLFPEVAIYGYCPAKKLYYYGLHGHLMMTVNGVITGCTVTTASGDEREALWELIEGVQGLVIGDKGYISALGKAELATVGIDLQTPLWVNMTERFRFEKIRARDQWHLTSRIARKILAHTLCIFVNRLFGRSDLRFECLIA